jgi:hypothetical protein
VRQPVARTPISSPTCGDREPRAMAPGQLAATRSFNGSAVAWSTRRSFAVTAPILLNCSLRLDPLSDKCSKNQEKYQAYILHNGS